MTMDETIVAKLSELENGGKVLEPYLIVTAGAQVGRLYPLQVGDLVAGRSPDSDIWIEDSTISRKHFKIKSNGKSFIIQDLHSTNGTYVNGDKIETTELNAGDQIRISRDTVIQFDFFDENRRLAEQKRYEMGVRDPVTHTYNKSYFLQRINDEFSYAMRQNIPLSVMILDVDFFKMINDTHGHLVGDKVLKELCDTVLKTIRSEDVFCRYGGEEFVLMMRNTRLEGACQIAERLRQRVEATPIANGDKSIRMTISIGVACFVDQNFSEYVGLIAEADKCLYKSKGSGRNRVTPTP